MTALAIPIATTVVVTMLEAAGAELAATFLAGVGCGTAMCHIVHTNIAIRRAGQG